MIGFDEFNKFLWYVNDMRSLYLLCLTIGVIIALASIDKTNLK